MRSAAYRPALGPVNGGSPLLAAAARYHGRMALRRIVSGGQAGVDRGALDAAMAAGLEHGGYCPRGRRAEDGAIPDRYRLEELAARAYRTRTEANVIHSDGTLVLAPGSPSGGTKLTVELARRHQRPLLVVDIDRESLEQSVARAVAWLASVRIEVLNVAGPRESGRPGIAARAQAIIAAIIAAERSTAEPEGPAGR